jgi:hypothetical protein
MHLVLHSLRASDHAVCGPSMIFACISDCLSAHLFPINSNKFGVISSRSVTQVRQFAAKMALFPTKYNLRLSHFDNACAICMHFRFDSLYLHGSSEYSNVITISNIATGFIKDLSITVFIKYVLVCITIGFIKYV